jgi:hypothetical protein
MPHHLASAVSQPAGHRDGGYVMSTKVVFKLSPFKLASRPDKKGGKVWQFCFALQNKKKKHF